MLESILDANLNGSITYADFFHAFGYGDNDKIYCRVFNDRDKKDKKSSRNRYRQLRNFDTLVPELQQYNHNNLGVFWVVNGGGNSDPEVLANGLARAQFFEVDDYPFPEQLEMINQFALEPSIIIKTRKSLHVYFLLKEGSTDIHKFREIQERFINHFKSDPRIKNESRVMRIPGFYHCKKDPVMVKLIKFNPELRYSQGEIYDAIPVAPPAKATQTGHGSDKASAGENKKFQLPDIIGKGDRNDVLFRYACSLRTRGRSATDTLDILKQTNLQRCVPSLSESELMMLYNSAMNYPANENMQVLEQAADDWEQKLQYTEKGAIKKTFSNLCIIVNGLYGTRLTFNVMDARIYIVRVPWELDNHPFRDNDLHHLRQEIHKRYGYGSEGDILSAVSLVAHDHYINPIVDKLKSLKWDGQSRIAELFPRYLGAERCEYTTGVTLLLFSGAIQRILNPGCKFDCTIILADTKQGTGKSSMCRFLALSDQYYTDSLGGDLTKTKDTFEITRGRWIIEMAEMLATRKTDLVEGIKAYISRQTDTYRTPYDKIAEDYPRRFIIIATTNRPAFLPSDRTGNRRFIPLLCNGDKAEQHPLKDEQFTRHFIEQCYAEVMERGKTQGFQLTLDSSYDHYLNEIREESSPEDDKTGMIQEWLDENREIKIVCSRMIWKEVFAGESKKSPASYELADISEIMNLKITGWQRYAGKSGTAKDNKFRFETYGKQRAWERVPTGGNDWVQIEDPVFD